MCYYDLTLSAYKFLVPSYMRLYASDGPYALYTNI